jgi:hypothetical protein
LLLANWLVGLSCRYDGRGALYDLKQYEALPGGHDANRWVGLSDAERRVEQLCDEERYRALHHNEEEEALYQGRDITVVCCRMCGRLLTQCTFFLNQLLFVCLLVAHYDQCLHVLLQSINTLFVCGAHMPLVMGQ